MVVIYEPKWLVIFLGPNRLLEFFSMGAIELLELVSILILNVYLIKLVIRLIMLGNCCLPGNC